MKVLLSEALDLSSREMVCTVGGGGKTTMVLTLASEALASHHPVIVTTTTKMGLNESSGLVSVNDENPLLGNQAVRWIGKVEGERILGRSKEEIDNYFSNFSGWLLVEADGARRRPIKAPASHEPPIPTQATVVVLNIGLDAIGKPIVDVSHRPEILAKILDVGIDALITPEMVASLIVHDSGGKKQIPDSSRFLVALTKCTEEREDLADQVIDGLSSETDPPERVLLIGQPGEVIRSEMLI